MARLRHGGDHVLLGLPPRDPFSGNAVAPPPGGLLQRKSSAVDFSDVFGGPTRRASLYEPRRGVGECAESYGFGRIGVGEDAGERSRRWSSSVVEKPALGGVGVGSPAHRRHLGDDFFSDIFRGNGDSPCPTLRKKDRADVLASTPVSRVLSPACPLPSTGDVLVRSFSTADHSFPTILAKSYDYSSFRSPTAYGVCKNEEMIPDVFSVPASPNAYAAANSNHLIRTKGSKANGGSGHFHFSIFKWASKGVTLIMPSNFKERTKSGSRFSEASPQVSRQEELPPDNEYLPNRVMSFQNQGEIDDKNPLSDLALAENENMDSSNEVTKLFPAASDIKSVLPGITDKSDDVHTCIKNSTSFPLEAAKLESVDLCHLLDDSDREGNEGITKKAKKEESLVSDCKTVMKGADGTAEVKQENRKNTILHYTEKVGKGMNYPSINSQDKMLSSRPQGKVKAFRKIFNEETGQRTGGTREVQASRYKVKDEIKGIVEDHASAHVVNAREDVGNNIEPLSTPIATGQNLKKAEQTISVRSSDARKIDGPFSEMNSTSVALSDSTVDSLDASFCNIDEAHFESIGEHMVEELSQDQNKVTEADLHQEEVQVETSDTRIQDWSKGKERNIRSLLSTLQYVLWPGSGWKAVALVDIIEGVSVRRAYQKALLCLHPDKLQQKGAEMHEKYIAEKVFDILQGAWTSFNSLSSLTL